MDPVLVARWFHLLAASTWMGGLVTLAAAVVVLRKAGADRSLLQALARGFAKVSWTAMAIAIATGLLQVAGMQLPWSYGRLHAKLGMVALVVVLALAHQLTARRSSPRTRGILQALILLASLGVFAAAVAL
jgi:uncharacterized membrane protein